MVKKAVIPAAGYGTRLLPATKSQPKEMIPIVDKPVIQYVIEEAVASGITDILMVIGKGKRAIEEHFDRNVELEFHLHQKAKWEELEMIRKITDMADIHFVWQKELNGLGDAIRYGKQHVGNEPFAVLLGDTIMESNDEKRITRQLIEVFEKHHSSVVALEEVPKELTFRYGVMGGTKIDESGIYQISELIEKPVPEEAPSNLVIAGRYVFTPEIFDYLEVIPTGVNNEIQLTDAMRLLLKDQKMYGLHFEGKRYDIGNKLDFIKTNLLFGMKRKEFGEELKSWVKEIGSKME
ncbi:MAG: UTP--glucose-1-phosphate uridylyltransferase GalU [Bacteroidetes bacterium]|nr:UTP--glucose-1-phosphate uridylyltransferase GalU [Bacteroidota bacterium]